MPHSKLFWEIVHNLKSSFSSNESPLLLGFPTWMRKSWATWILCQCGTRLTWRFLGVSARSSCWDWWRFSWVSTSQLSSPREQCSLAQELPRWRRKSKRPRTNAQDSLLGEGTIWILMKILWNKVCHKNHVSCESVNADLKFEVYCKRLYSYLYSHILC